MRALTAGTALAMSSVPDAMAQSARTECRGIPDAIAAAIEQHTQLKGTPEGREIAEASSLHNSSNNERGLDYSRLHEAFAWAHFETNYWKAYQACAVAPSRQPQKILDLGCGSGAAGLALLARLGKQEAPSGGRVEIHFADASMQQLALARHHFEIVQPLLGPWRVDASYRRLDITRCSALGGGYDAILLSHLLTENRPQAGAIIAKCAAAARPGAAIYIIERASDSALHQAVLRSLWRVCLPYSITVQEIKPAALGYERRTETGGDATGRYWCLRLEVPHSPMPCQLAAEYFLAWKSRDTAYLKHVFAKDAQYIIKNKRQKIVGLDGIEGYWRRYVEPQQDLSIELSSLAAGKSSISFAWHSTFLRQDRQCTLDGSMKIAIDAQTERIHKLSEMYRSRWETNGVGACTAAV